MKKGLTELVFILDRSGSMIGLEQDTIRGYNAMLKKQKQEKGEAVITTVLFDDQYELLHDRIAIKGVRPLTDREYFVRGATALLDAIGKTIHKIGHAQKNTAEAERAEKVLFVITTDGQENASREYDYSKIRQQIRRQQEDYGWEFLFLGANIDAISEAERFGIAPERAANYHADSAGTELNFDVMCEAISELRVNKCISKDWKQRIDQDFETRSNG